MLQSNADTLVNARSRLARRQLAVLLAEARAELVAAETGDMAAVHGLHRAMVTREHRLDAA